MECMVGHFDLWAGPQSLRHVVAALEIAYQIHDGPNIALAMDRTGKHVMGRLPIGEAPTNIRERKV